MTHIPTETVFDADDIEQHKAVAAMSYVWVLWVVPLFLKRGSAFATFHAKQGLVLFIVESLAMLVAWIPVVNFVLFFGLIAIAVIGITNALKGLALPLPIVGKWAHYFHL
jgi:uncharacterized membrane protein